MRLRARWGGCGWRVAVAVLSCGALVTCAPLPEPAFSLAPSPACPRDSGLQSGRCTCARDRVLVLGACVEPAVRDAYCGPAARPGPDGACAFRACANGEALDDSGNCIPVGSVARSGPRCEAPATLVVTGGGRAACVSLDAACPRGSHAEGDACRAGPACPPGALWSGRECRALVHAGSGGGGGAGGGSPRGAVVDLGVWTALALGPDGGPGSSELCRPLQSAPLAFELSRGDRLEVRLSITIAVPDQDVSRVFASVHAQAWQAGQAQPLPPGAERAVDRALTTLVEPLRGLGGESSTAAVQVQVRCAVASL